MYFQTRVKLICGSVNRLPRHPRNLSLAVVECRRWSLLGPLCLLKQTVIAHGLGKEIFLLQKVLSSPCIPGKRQ